MLRLSLPSASTEDIAPTVGFVNGSTHLSGCNLSLLDLGGGERLREIWHNYYAEVRAYVRMYVCGTLQLHTTLMLVLQRCRVGWSQVKCSRTSL